MGIEFIISNNTIVLGQRKEQSNTHLELESRAQKKGSGRVVRGCISKERRGDCNEKTPISQIGLKGGGPQKFKLQKCIKWRIVRPRACWWSQCVFPLRRPSRQQWAWSFLTFPSRDAPGPEGSAAPLPCQRAGVAGSGFAGCSAVPAAPRCWR